MCEDGGACAEGVHGRGDGGGHAVLGEARAVGAAAAEERRERVETVHVQALLARELRHRGDQHRRRAHRKVLSQRGCRVVHQMRMRVVGPRTKREEGANG